MTCESPANSYYIHFYVIFSKMALILPRLLGRRSVARNELIDATAALVNWPRRRRNNVGTRTDRPSMPVTVVYAWQNGKVRHNQGASHFYCKLCRFAFFCSDSRQSHCDMLRWERLKKEQASRLQILRALMTPNSNESVTRARCSRSTKKSAKPGQRIWWSRPCHLIATAVA